MQTRKIVISREVAERLIELRIYLAVELKLSEKAAISRTEKMRDFLKSLGTPVDYSLCRFSRWKTLDYRCAVFEKNWVFAYEVVPQGIIVRDMSHASVLVV
jgi:hypothetical protein